MELIESILFLLFWNNPNLLIPFLGNRNNHSELEDQMNSRCESCLLFGCRCTKVAGKITGGSNIEPIHGSRNSNLLSAFSVGESLGDVMSNFAGVKPEPKILIPPSSALSIESRYGANKEMQKVDLKDEWVNCSLCRAKVFIKYLDKHLLVHTNNFETNNPTTTAIVRHVASIPPKQEETKKTENKPQLNNIERYKFRQLEQACCASSMSRNGRYSDFTITFWEKDKPTVHSVVYSGGVTSYASKDWERFTIHIAYDSVEDYFTVTSKLLKRSSYSSWDVEDTVVPDRICYQEELFTEIKRALLFFRISPKSAYKHFRRLFKQELITDLDPNGRAFITQTQNCESLQNRLKKTTTHSGGYDCSN